MHLSKIILLIPALFALTAFAQRKVNPTDTLKISGKIKSELTLTLSGFDTMAKDSIGDLVITNQHGEVKKTIKHLKGVQLKKILDRITIEVEKPKILNEFYFVFVASDNYKAVFSWNEIYNTEVGNGLYLITEQDGIKMKDMEGRILVVSTKDIQIGRRHIKGLQKIIVERVN